MGQIVVNVGSFDKNSANGVTVYGTTVNFTIPANAGITGCSVAFVTHNSGGTTQDRAFALNGARAHSSGSWASAGALSHTLLSTGDNTFRVTLKSQAGAACWWNISSITLTIDYNDVGGGGGTTDPGTISISKTSLTAGEGLTVSVTGASGGVYRDVYIQKMPSTANILSVAQGHGSGAGSWAVTIPESWCATHSPDDPSFEVRIYMVSYIAGGTVVGDGAKMLTVNVPAAGTITPPSSVIAGDTLSIPISAAGGSVTRRVGIYSGATLLATVAAGQGSAAGTLTYTIPTSWCTTYAPNATYFDVTVRMEPLISGAVIYGTVEKALRINVPTSAVPTIGNVTAGYIANGVDGSITNYVQNYSKCYLEVLSPAGALGSTIAAVEITGGGFSAASSTATFGPFSQTGYITFTAKVTDTRGRTGTKAVTINVMAYSAVKFSAPEAWRSSNIGVKNQRGTYVRLKSGVSYSGLAGQNTVSLKGRVYIKGGAAPAWTAMALDTALILGGGTLLITKTYVAQMIVQDKITSTTIEFIIPTKKTGISIMAGMQGAAVGKSAETPGIFDVLWPVVAPGIPPNPNLLHNWDFRNPVNQRGVSGSVPIGYFLDRWKNEAGACIVNAGHIIVGNPSLYEYSWISQTIENDMAGLTCTFSMVDTIGNLYKCTSTFPTSRDTYNTQQIAGDGYLQFKTDLGATCSIRIIRGESLAIQFVKLELGTVSTLHLDPPMDHTVELLKCQRYLFKVTGYLGRVMEYTTTSARFTIPTPAKMRITPSVASGSATWYSNTTNGISATIGAIGLSENAVNFTFINGNGGVDGFVYANTLLLSAEL